LAIDDKLRIFTSSHQTDAEHRNSVFLPWHRYFLYELETQFRLLGDQYRCFALPYWDWTKDIEDYNYTIELYSILNSGLGGNGQGNNDCVGAGFADYTASTIVDNVNVPCLRRVACTRGCDWNGPESASDLKALLEGSGNYAIFRDGLEGTPHGWAHVSIGGSGHLGWVANSPDDPVFYMLHAMVDMQWALWQDCYNYDQVSPHDIDNTMYDGNPDLVMEWGNLSSKSWSHVSTLENGVTPRDMHSIADWDVSYDKGSYFEAAEVESVESICNGRINEIWFKDVARRRLQKDSKEISQRSEYGQYAHDVFTRLSSKMKMREGSTTLRDESRSKRKEQRDLFKTWSRINCEYRQMGHKCHRPKYFDDCSDMNKTQQKRNGRIYMDIDVSLDELIEKVSSSLCMISTREKMFNWCWSTGDLYGLCKGRYDRFCDKDFKNEKGEAQCSENIYRKKRNRRGNRQNALIGDLSMIDDDYYNDNDHKNKFTHLEEMLINGVINGGIFALVFLFCISCYFVIKNQLITSRKKEIYKYDMVDAENA